MNFKQRSVLLFLCYFGPRYIKRNVVSSKVACALEDFVSGDDDPVRLFNTLRPKQNGRHFADDIFKCICLNENAWTSVKISIKFVPKGPINNIPSLVQIMAWRRPGDKPLSEPMVVSLPTHICVTRPQWIKIIDLHQSCMGYILCLMAAYMVMHPGY